jgi:hypothetical protein
MALTQLSLIPALWPMAPAAVEVQLETPDEAYRAAVAVAHLAPHVLKTARRIRKIRRAPQNVADSQPV